jgi:hypothetical protein
MSKLKHLDIDVSASKLKSYIIQLEARLKVAERAEKHNARKTMMISASYHKGVSESLKNVISDLKNIT